MLKIEGGIIDLIGAEGSGKTSVARNLSDFTGLPYVTMGDILREIRDDKNSPYSEEVREMFEQHTYLDPNTLLLIQAEFFNNERFRNGFILDGGLRTVTEAQGFPKMLDKAGVSMEVIVVYLMAPREICEERLLGSSGRRRDDDTPEGVKSRLDRFYDNLDGRLDAIKENFRIIEIDADQSKEDVFNDVIRALEGRNK